MDEKGYDGTIQGNNDRKISNEGKLMKAGDVTVYDIGTQNVAVEISPNLQRALQSPLSLYAMQLLLGKASSSERTAHYDEYARQDIRRTSDLLHQIEPLINGQVRIADDKFQDVRGLATEAYVVGLLSRLGIPYSISSWVDDWKKFKDFIVDPNTAQPTAVDVTSTAHFDGLVHKLRDHPEVATLVVPYKTFPNWLLGGKFDDESHIDIATKAMNALTREDPVDIKSLRLNNSDISGVIQTMQEEMRSSPDMRWNMVDQAKDLATFNLKLMSALSRPNTDSSVKITKELGARTVNLSQRIQRAAAGH